MAYMYVRILFVANSFTNCTNSSTNCMRLYSRDEKLTNKLSADNITDYSVGWTENGVDVAVKGRCSGIMFH